MPPKCVKDVMTSPLENSSLPVSESKAYSVACVDPASRSLVFMPRPAASDCRTSSPLQSANTTPLAMIGGSGTLRSREIHAGTISGAPFFAVMRKAMMLPCGVGPLVMANGFALGCGVPQAGAKSQRTDCGSSHVANDPQKP